ncbi:NADH-quinone oxidoreductase subunit M [Neobacillus thermocopriae]|uniref:NADH-quinone oxidoreductase subunit M n=1 Tax=Neobacillus thermocopriae TaxID=1215031 RepID=A0A6B3TNP7_9BACI|nr:NADH-quinone oxidoreductase subunit M [Neobacillus thermocopriae]MED3623883.1 NADH-quinone oxidoreductase subunit M [Neobacillus thermocopriae]MED3713339.1 NADH-quinone oxidoreductase subunit M [Neobacillus thermocopriae]NEX78222.1 NADH-quinone oxidoreductase subunit M [Neobacillus thermocopriae]
MNLNWVLSTLVFSPLLGIILLAFLPKTQEKLIKLVGLLATLPALVLSLAAYFHYLAGKKLSDFSVSAEWIQFRGMNANEPIFSVYYELGLSGFQLLLVVLTAIVATLSAIAARYVKKEWKGFFMLFLLLEVGMLGVFTAENLILFFLFFEITLIPTFFLIGKWGYFEKEKAAYSFLIYNGLGSAVLLIVIMILFAKTGTTNVELLSQMIADPTAPLSADLKLGLFIALLIAFGVKLPIFPLHSWMLRVHVQAPPAVVMIHSGILLKIGAYGLIRFGMGIFPEQFEMLAVLLAILGVINLLYGAFLAFIQSDFKMVLAYSSISHMGIVLIGLAAMNEAGIQGAIFQVISHGLISALLFFLVGVLYERTETSIIDHLGGLAKGMPIAAGFLLAGAMASLGLPGMSGFVSEFMAFLGLFKVQPWIAAVGTIGIIMTAVYLLRAVLGMTFAQAHRKFDAIVDLKGVEYVPVIVLMLLIVLIGVYPSVLSSPLQATLETIMLGLGG